jgi:hypothetical protein
MYDGVYFMAIQDGVQVWTDGAWDISIVIFNVGDYIRDSVLHCWLGIISHEDIGC